MLQFCTSWPSRERRWQYSPYVGCVVHGIVVTYICSDTHCRRETFSPPCAVYGKETARTHRYEHINIETRAPVPPWLHGWPESLRSASPAQTTRPLRDKAALEAYRPWNRGRKRSTRNEIPIIPSLQSLNEDRWQRSECCYRPRTKRNTNTTSWFPDSHQDRRVSRTNFTATAGFCRVIRR